MALLRRLAFRGQARRRLRRDVEEHHGHNYCGITPDLVEFISDTTPIKQGKFSPGAHIPVKPSSEFTARYPDYALLFAWNHEEEIRAKERAFIEHGGRWIVYVPGVEIRQ